jgi:hypothetical protein
MSNMASYRARARHIKHQRCGRNHIKIIIRSRRVKDIGSVQMGGDLRLDFLMQMEKAKWSAELW